MINSSTSGNSGKCISFRLFFALMLFNTSTTAWSICNNETSDGSPYFIAVTNDLQVPEFNPDAIRVGQAIHKQRLVARIINKRGPIAITTCDPSIGSFYISGISNALPPYFTYPSSIPNIGIRLRDVSGSLLPSSAGFSPASYSLRWPPDESPRYIYNIELIKIGDIVTGGMLTGAYAQIDIAIPGRQRLIEFRFGSPVPVIPRIPTCKTTTPTVNVDLGSTPTTSFNGVGSGAPPKPFKIALSCAGGATGTSTNAHVTLTDANTPGNISTTLSLANGSTPGRSTASGIGIEILNKGQPLGFGPDSSQAGNTNQWFVGSISQGQTILEIPLEARYVQTAPSISPGSANARATFTFSYQ